MPSWAEERRDLAIVALTSVLIPLVWIALLGWRGALLGAHDSALYFLLLREGLPAFSPRMLGGIAATGVYGAAPSLVLGAPLGAIFAFNFAVLSTQVCHGVLAASASLDLASLFGERPRARSIVLGTVLAVVFAFTPVLGWRLSYGHLNLVWGTFVLTAPLACLAAARAGRARVTVSVVALFALLHAFQSHGFQTILYAALFGGPILAAIGWRAGSTRDALRVLGIPALVVALALGIAAPKLWAMLSYAIGPDATRTAGDVRGFSYLTATPRDWVSSLAWSPRVVGSGRPEAFDHETHYALGPMLLLLALVPFRRARGLAMSLAWAFVVPVLISSNVPPFSTLFVRLPFVAAFRVPARAMLPFALVLPVVAVAALLSREDGRARSRLARFAPLVLVPLLLVPAPPLVREVCAWSIAALVVLAAYKPMPLDPAVVAALLGALSLSAFRERLLPFLSADALIREPEALGRAARARVPELASPLERVSLQLSLPAFGPNTAAASGLSSIDGYGYPTRRYLQLAALTSGQPFDPLQTIMVFDPRTHAFRVMGQLYNVRAILVPAGAGDPRGPLVDIRPGPTAGAAWFSGRLEPVANFAELGSVLNANAPVLASKAHEVAWIVADDPVVHAPATVAAECHGARVERVEAFSRDRSVHVQVATPADCPLTIAMNYLATFRARAGDRALEVFPSYGALTAVIVPAGAREIVVDTSP